MRPRRFSALLATFALFALSLALRVVFFQGFVLGDDAEEFLLVDHISHAGLDFQAHRHLEYRFPMWGLELLSQRWLGTGELGFFLPGVLLSASFAPLALALLRSLGYGLAAAFLVGLVVAAAPFEVVLGTLRANDLVLAWCLAIGLVAFVALPRRPALQGIALAAAGWLAFSAKLWAIYALPALGVHYLLRLRREGEWRGPAAFTLASLALHGATAAFWKQHMGAWLPFLADHSATYPVARADLGTVLTYYPRILFTGSEHGTTLFGALPWLLLALLAASVLLRSRRRAAHAASFDRADRALLAHLVAFFLLLELFPTAFRLDAYYSVPRIFRYLAPLSFPLALLAGKRLLDLTSPAARAGAAPGRSAIAALLALAVLCVLQAAEATRPGRAHRTALLGVVATLERDCPPALLVEYRLGAILQHAYLRSRCPPLELQPFLLDRPAAEYEAWLRENERTLPPGTALVSGLASYVHYGCPKTCGFQLARFETPLGAAWGAPAEIGPGPAEPVRVWRLTPRGAEP